MMLILLALLALAASQNSPPVSGTAQLTIDLTGLSQDVQVSIDNRDVYRDQGGEVRTYTVRTTNAERAYQVIITEGAAATVIKSINLINGNVKTLRDFRATLRIHLERYSVPQGNSYAVKLRAQIGANQNVFREYNDAEGAPHRLPLEQLGSTPSATAFEVVVLAIAEPVTVWAGEYHGATLAVSVVGHNGNGLAVEPDCSDFRCDSGRLVARATAALECLGASNYSLPLTDRLQLIHNPSPTVSPVEVVREWTNVASDTYVWWVLAVDNYQVHAERRDVEKVSALNCAIGECEANPLTSVLSVFHSSLRGSLDVSVQMEGAYVPFDRFQTVDADVTHICVYNLPLTRVVATIETGGVVDAAPINCGDTNQRCNVYVYAELTPNFNCLPTSGVELATVVTQGATRVYQRWGTVEAVLIVPALNNLVVSFYDGATEWTPEGFYPAVVNGEATWSTPATDCSPVIDTTTRHQDGNAPGSCVTVAQADRMLSIFDLAFLPAVEAGYAGDGKIPENGDSNNVTVTLQNGPNDVWRFLPNQGGAPRMYCVLPVELETKIDESCACWTSETVDCRVQAAEGADCSVCDFLSILEYDLTGLPREVNSIIYAGPRDGEPVTIVDEKFSGFSVPTGHACEVQVNGSSINFENRYPPSATIEVWGQGCNGAPTHLPDGTPTGNTLKVGNMEPYHAGVPEPLPFVNNTCVTFTVPEGVSQINVAFYAWQHGNGNNDTNAWVIARGATSGVSLKSWIQVTPNAWTLNQVRLLNVVEGEKAEVCFEQNGRFGTQVDNVHLDATAYKLCPIRWMYWQGNYFNQIPVLRTGSGQGCPAGVYGRYCVRVYDGAAWKQECVSCDDKTCEPYQPFKCELCLDLASPNDTPGLENAIKVSINVGSSSVRQVVGQGGTNGCARSKKEVSATRRKFAALERRKEEARGLTSESMQRLEVAEVERIRREILTEIADEYRKAQGARAGPYTDPGQTQSVFPVLCLRYRVCVSEACVEPVCFDVDCTEYGTCSYENIIALASVPFDCPTLPNNLALTLYSKDSKFDYETGQLKPETGCQVRGETGRMLLDPETCVWSPPKFVGPSYENVGGGLFTFPVLRTDYLIRVDENTVGFTYGTVQPDPLQHPYSTAPLDCTGTDACGVTTGSLVSKWHISSERGLPQAPDARLAIKFGDNSQNVIRSIPAFQLQAPQVNEICVLSDERPWYVALWGTWSSRGANLPFDSCASNTSTLDDCPTNVVVPPRSR